MPHGRTRVSNAPTHQAGAGTSARPHLPTSHSTVFAAALRSTTTNGCFVPGVTSRGTLVSLCCAPATRVRARQRGKPHRVAAQSPSTRRGTARAGARSARAALLQPRHPPGATTCVRRQRCVPRARLCTRGRRPGRGAARDALPTYRSLRAQAPPRGRAAQSSPQPQAPPCCASCRQAPHADAGAPHATSCRDLRRALSGHPRVSSLPAGGEGRVFRPLLSNRGVTLLPVALLNRRDCQARDAAWYSSSSPSASATQPSPPGASAGSARRACNPTRACRTLQAASVHGAQRRSFLQHAHECTHRCV